MAIDLDIRKLTKQYTKQVVINQLSYHLHEGLFAITGNNGVGKSTLLRLLANAEKPDYGEILLNGKPTHRLTSKQKIAYVPDTLSFFSQTTGQEFLHFIQAIRKQTIDPSPFIDAFHLNPFLDTALAKLSLGNIKKFFLSAAFIGQPELLIMDEPSTGLDANAKQVLIEKILELHQSKPCISIVSSHDDDFIKKLNANNLRLQNSQLTIYHTKHPSVENALIST